MADHAASRLPLAALVAANLLPVFGVLYMDWDVGSIVVLYWTENLVIGAYAILRMLVAGGSKAGFPVLFFCLHYGLFCAIHGAFVLELTGYPGLEGPETGETEWPGPLLLVQMAIGLARAILAAAPAAFGWACLALVLSHGVSFLLLYVGQGEFRRTTVKAEMQAPYRRIVVLHVAILTGAFLVNAIGSPIGLLLALVALKTVMDIMLHKRSHQRVNQPAGRKQPSGD